MQRKQRSKTESRHSIVAIRALPVLRPGLAARLTDQEPGTACAATDNGREDLWTFPT